MNGPPGLNAIESAMAASSSLIESVTTQGLQTMGNTASESGNAIVSAIQK